MTEFDLALFGLGAAGWIGAVAFDRYQDRLPTDLRASLGLLDLEDPRTVEEIKAAYTRGHISDVEMDRRLAVALDSDRQRLRATVETVSGIGPDTSWSIAEAVATERELQEASLKELEEIPNVGEQRARQLQERVGR